jgi:hypothetical protein
MKIMFKYMAVVCLLMLSATAQDIKFPASLDKLAEKATEVVDVTLDANLLQLASRFLSDRDADQAKVKKLVSGLKGVYVRVFEFDRPGEYEPSDVESIRSQLRTPTWARVASVRSRRAGENAEVYLKSEGGQITGLTVIAAEPRQLTLVNIVGPINPEDIADLGGHFGIPRIDTVTTPKPPKESNKED